MSASRDRWQQCADTWVGRVSRTTLIALVVANFLNFFDRQVLSALAPTLKAYWQLSDYQIGLLATGFEIAYALAPLPIALIADRWLRRRIVALAIAVAGAAMACTAAAPSFAWLLFGRAGLGASQAGYGPAALAWLSDLFPPAKRSRIIGVHDLALMLGTAAGYALGAIAGQLLGWRPVFLAAALPGLALAAFVWQLPEPPSGFSEYRARGNIPVEPTPSPTLTALSALLKTPTLLMTFAVAVLINIATAGLTYWLPSFAVRVHGVTEAQAGLVIGLLSMLAGGAGVLCGGWVADALLARTLTGRLLTIVLSYAVGLPLAVAAVFATRWIPFVILAALAVYAFTFYFPCMAPLIHQVTRPQMRATAMAFYLLTVHLLANAIAPAWVGWVSDQTGDLRLGISAALLSALLAVVVGTAGLRFVSTDSQAMIDSMGINDPQETTRYSTNPVEQETE